jgi:ribosomal protein S18 acetylase RimI-like enzyme
MEELIASYALFLSSYHDAHMIAAESDRDSGAACCYGLMYPGFLGAVGGVSGPTEAAEVELLRHVMMELFHAGAELVQALTFEPEPIGCERSAVYQQAGLNRIARLVQMEVELHGASQERPSSRLTWVPYQLSNRERMIRVLERSYDGTCDVPELNGIRSTSNSMRGYEYSLSEDSRQWFLLQEGMNDVGCVLLAINRDPRIWELSYMGLVPESRGRGLSRDLFAQLLGICSQKGCRTLQLAVDERNEPAVRLYRRFGCRETNRIDAWFKFPDP